jgi:two-component sensor histidine kinase
MALHELCTNATKYGALSSDKGRVELSWSVERGDRPRLQLRWSEIDGPPVVPPSQTGFGTRMLHRALAVALKAQVVLDYATTGLVCTIDALNSELF